MEILEGPANQGGKLSPSGVPLNQWYTGFTN